MLKARLNNPAYDFARISEGASANDDPWENTYLLTRHSNLDNQMGWAMPWQNAGETALPESEYTSALPESYTRNLERMHDMSVESTGSWIEQHGFFNPNMLLDGTFEKIGRVGLLELPEGPGVDIDDGETKDDSAPDYKGSTFFRFTGDEEDDTEKILRQLGVIVDPPKTPPKVVVPQLQPTKKQPPTIAPTRPAPVVAVVPTTVPTNSGHSKGPKGTVVFNEAHNTTHHYSYAPAPEALHYTPLPPSTKHVDMGFVHHMERLSHAGAVKTI